MARKPKMETAVRRGDVSSIVPLVAKFSHETWEKFPSNAKHYWSVEDLIALGVGHLVTKVVKQYRGERYKKAQFITYAYISLKNLYKGLLDELYADKRVGKEVSGNEPVRMKNKTVELFDAIAVVNKYQQEDFMLARCDAERAFLIVYSQASPHLRKHLINWCIQPSKTKYKLSGSKFIAARREFKQKMLDQVLTQELVATIQGDAICRSRLVLSILKNEGFRTVRRGKILERELLPAVIDEDAKEFYDISVTGVGGEYPAHNLLRKKT